MQQSSSAADVISGWTAVSPRVMAGEPRGWHDRVMHGSCRCPHKLVSLWWPERQLQRRRHGRVR